MNITIDHSRKPEARQEAGRTAAAPDIGQTAGTRPRGAYALDISGKVMDNTAYEGQGKTAEDVMQEAGLTDVALLKNYMAVMSNSMSDEDFARLQEEGFHPGSTEIKTVVTIVDQIKASLAKGGADIAGYTDDIDLEALESITGSKGLAAKIVKQFQEQDIPLTKDTMRQTATAIEKADAVAEQGELSEGNVKYMLNNRMEPTIDNLYRAQHSSLNDAGKQGRGYYRESDSGYYTKKADDFQWDNLRPQMEAVIEETGLTVNEETLKEAKWLVEKGIPLTTESLRALNELNSSELTGSPEKIIAAIASALSDGKQAGKANLADTRSYAERAADIVEEFASITAEAVDLAASKGKGINLYRLKAAQESIRNSSVSEAPVSDITNRRMLEEVRLKMTIEAGIRLQRKGFTIETAELSDLVDALRAEEAAAWQTLLGSEEGISDKAALYQDTMAKVSGIPYLPAAVIGTFAGLDDNAPEFTLSAVQEAGTAIKNAYEKAGETYEALMTAPRFDLGDSIKKAFSNIDTILKDLNLEQNEANRKAVRILGYNNMEITEASIMSVKKAELTVNQAVTGLTPARVLSMIRNDINPLTLNMDELNQYLNEAEPLQEEFDKYSRFLYQLEQEHAITSEERTAYIGTYRLLRQLEKSDGAAIGALVQSGAELSFKNLLTAIRSSKNKGMDVRVDDVGEITQKVFQGDSITSQIEEGYKKSGSDDKTAYYQKLERDIFRQFDKSILSPDFLQADPSLEAMAEMQKRQENTARHQQYSLNQMREALTSEDSVIRMLLDFDQPVTADNLAAAGLLQHARGKLAQRLRELSKEAEAVKEFDEAVEGLQEGLTDEESAQKAYSKLEETCSDILEKIVYESAQTGTLDMREIGSLYKQIRLTGSLAREENYEVPVNVNGSYTSINLRIVHDSRENGRVTVSMETAELGKAAAVFKLRTSEEEGSVLTGYVACASKEGLAHLQERKEAFLNGLSETDIKTEQLPFVLSDELDMENVNRVTDKESKETNAAETVSTKKLYEIAKLFIAHIQ